MFNLNATRYSIVPLMLMLMFTTAFACGAGNNSLGEPVPVVTAE